jgi:glucose/arabinose dehydrogenase
MKFFLLAISTFSLVITTSLSAKPKAKLFIENLKKPTFLTAPKNSTDYLYILEKEGRIRAYDRKQNTLLEKSVLDISKKIEIKMNEQGLLGLAFCPNYEQSKRLYLYYTDLAGDTRVSRFTMKSPTEAHPNEEILLKQKQDFRNHNGGWISFGPDGMLYIALGDGGSANDPKKRSQDLTTFLGKLLRIDVSSAEGYTIPPNNPYKEGADKSYLNPFVRKEALPEILSFGLRNPWRCTWHKSRLIIADVGQNAWEEINNVDHENLFGANFGWPQFEGSHKTKHKSESEPNEGQLIMPIYEYKHDDSPTGGLSITGGYIYKGSVKELQGRYIFADWIKPHIWSGKLSITGLEDLKHHKDDFSQNGTAIQQICSFGEDPQGELYIISHLGKIYQITD